MTRAATYHGSGEPILRRGSKRLKKPKKKKTSDDSSQMDTNSSAQDENEGLLTATLTQLFGEEYPFPLLDTSNQMQPDERWMGNIEMPSDEESNDTGGDWISKLSKAIGDKGVPSHIDGSESPWPLSLHIPAFDIPQVDTASLMFSLKNRLQLLQEQVWSLQLRPQGQPMIDWQPAQGQALKPCSFYRN